MQFAIKWINQERLCDGLTPKQSVTGNQSILCLAPITRHILERQAMNEYQVMFTTGEVVEIEAWTPEIAQAIAEEDAGQSIVSVQPLQPIEE
jgi:hypothetical protein